MNYTERVVSILKYAESRAMEYHQLVNPLHVLVAIVQEKTGVCGEFFLTYPKLAFELDQNLKDVADTEGKNRVKSSTFTLPISLSLEHVLKDAHSRMERYNQVFINEGHLLAAILKSEDPHIQKVICHIDVTKALTIISSPRDMIVSLRNYSFPSLVKNNLTFRKAVAGDYKILKQFVEQEFGQGWIESLETGFSQKTIPIYIALEKKTIIGFACFDVVRNKKGLFGPMGTSKENRTKGIGYTLLHKCLAEMKEIGYEYAVIGEAGPLEFYEKSCGAVVIPIRI